MSTESNKAVIRNMLLVFEKGDTKISISTSPRTGSIMTLRCPRCKDSKAQSSWLICGAAFSERKVTIEDAVAEGDKVAMRFSITGKHTGAMMGIAPTGKTIHISASGIFRIVDGKATDNWVNFDALGLLQQLGAVPMPQM